jgi:hypothetical protein
MRHLSRRSARPPDTRPIQSSREIVNTLYHDRGSMAVFEKIRSNPASLLPTITEET